MLGHDQEIKRSPRVFAVLQHARDRSVMCLWGYLLLISVAEFLIAAGWFYAGLTFHALLLMGLTVHGTTERSRSVGTCILALTFAPLIRLLSLSLPLTNLPRVGWYLVVSLPLLIAAVTFIRQTRISWSVLGVRPGLVPLQLMLAGGGLGLGTVEYAILRPDGLVETLSWEAIWLPALVLIVSTGCVEELIFRGLLQHATMPVLGRAAFVYVALLFAVLHIGYLSALDVGFVFLVGLLFAHLVYLGRSLLGVALAHGLANVMLFLVLPLLDRSIADDVRERIAQATGAGTLAALVATLVLLWSAARQGRLALPVAEKLGAGQTTEQGLGVAPASQVTALAAALPQHGVRGSSPGNIAAATSGAGHPSALQRARFSPVHRNGQRPAPWTLVAVGSVRKRRFLVVFGLGVAVIGAMIASWISAASPFTALRAPVRDDRLSGATVTNSATPGASPVARETTSSRSTTDRLFPTEAAGRAAGPRGSHATSQASTTASVTAGSDPSPPAQTTSLAMGTSPGHARPQSPVDQQPTAPDQSPTLQPQSTPTGRSAIAVLQLVSQAEASLRSGWLEATMEYSDGSRSRAELRFDLGSSNVSPRYHILTTYTSVSATQRAERIVIGNQIWQRRNDEPWTMLIAEEGVWSQVQAFLPRAASGTRASMHLLGHASELRWHDPGRNMDLILVVDSATAEPQTMQQVPRSSGAVLNVTWKGWNIPVQITPPDGASAMPGRSQE